MKIYILAYADNLSYDIGLSCFNSYEDAYRLMKEEYLEAVNEYPESIEDTEISNVKAYIMFINGDVQYWNINRI
ncbi:MAG: hypothetical protein LIO53_09115 [Oscillospiraceae bacterium]|nr:hypothetical protein [Oscillospiraceae bacterium]